MAVVLLGTGATLHGGIGALDPRPAYLAATLTLAGLWLPGRIRRALDARHGAGRLAAWGVGDLLLWVAG